MYMEGYDVVGLCLYVFLFCIENSVFYLFFLVCVDYMRCKIGFVEFYKLSFYNFRSRVW